MANGMAGLFVGASGLKTAQTALNTTAHNLSNITQPDIQDSRLLSLILHMSMSTARTK